MGENKREVESDEVDRLLDEIPKATSGNTHYEEFQPNALFVDSCKGSHSDRITKNGSSQQRKMASAIGVQNSINKASPVNEPKSPDGQSLASAFAKLNVGGYGLESQYAKNLTVHLLNANSQIRRSGSDGVYGARIARENADAFYVDHFGLKSHQVAGSNQQINDTACEISTVNGGVQFVSNSPAHAIDLRIENQQQYSMNPQSLLPYVYLQHMDRSRTAWRSVEHENVYKLYQQSLFYQHLLNQHFEAQCPVQSNETHVSKGGQFIEIPVSQCLEQPKQELLLHGYGLTEGLKRQSGTLSPSNARAVLTLDRTSDPGFTDNSTSRSNGIGSLRPMKYGTAEDTLNHVNQNTRGASNCRLYHGFRGPNNAKFFQERSYDTRLLPLKYSCASEASNRTRLMAKDQNGCRYLQRKISEGSPKDVEKVFIDIIDHIVELMTDPFGNYLAQKLLAVCSEDQQFRILQVITKNSGDLARISCDMHG